MQVRDPRPTWKSTLSGLAVALMFTGPAWGQQSKLEPVKSAADEKKAGPVVRTFGAEGGYRTEVSSETKGNLSQEDRRQVSLLAAQVFQHVDEARRALDADDANRASRELEKGREAIKAIRAVLPTTSVHTRTTAPDGKVIYKDDRDVQEHRVPLFEGMIHARTLAPIVAAQRDAVQVAGVRVVESETISTEVIVDLDEVDAQLARAAKALGEKKSDVASAALIAAQVKGVDVSYRKEDSPLAEARDAIWLAKRALEENNSAQAQANLTAARQRLEIFRQFLPENQRQEVTQMMTEVGQLEAKLRQEVNQPTSQAERTRQGNAVTRWWDQVNGWFRKQF